MTHTCNQRNPRKHQFKDGLYLSPIPRSRLKDVHAAACQSIWSLMLLCHSKPVVFLVSRTILFWLLSNHPTTFHVSSHCFDLVLALLTRSHTSMLAFHLWSSIFNDLYTLQYCLQLLQTGALRRVSNFNINTRCWSCVILGFQFGKIFLCTVSFW